MAAQGFSRQAPDSIPACVVFGLDTAKKSVPATVLERSWVDVPDAAVPVRWNSWFWRQVYRKDSEAVLSPRVRSCAMHCALYSSVPLDGGLAPCVRIAGPCVLCERVIEGQFLKF